MEHRSPVFCGALILCTLSIFVNRSFMQDCVYFARDCQDIHALGHTKSGVYMVSLFSDYERYEVYCDMETDKGGWLIIQRRNNGSVDFYRDWNEYELGFGDPTGEFWLGNIFLHYLTSSAKYHLRIDMEDWTGNTTFASYIGFKIQSLADNYKIEIGGYFGDAGDSLRSSHNHIFQTFDKDSSTDVAYKYKSGWWLTDAVESNLNGQYKGGDEIVSKRHGIQWVSWKGFKYSLKSTTMKIKRL